MYQPLILIFFLTYPNTSNFVKDEIIEHVCSDEHEEIDCSYCELYCDEELDDIQ